jgi:hypothetical protein
MLIRILSSDWSISIQVERKIGCISIPSKSIQVFSFKFLVWYTRSKNLNGDLDAKLVSCIPGFKLDCSKTGAAVIHDLSPGL